MSTSQPLLDPTAQQTLLDLVRAQSPHPEAMTLAEAEAAVMTLLRQLGPLLVQAALDGDRPAAEGVKKKASPRSAAARRCASGGGAPAR